MRIAFARWRSGGLFNHRSPMKRLLPKKKTSSGFEFVSGLADGASAMPAKWSRPVFSFRFYEGKISRPLIVIPHLCGKHTVIVHHAADKRDELAAPHSITSSARPSRVAGMVRPRAFAVFRLITSSILVAC